HQMRASTPRWNTFVLLLAGLSITGPAAAQTCPDPATLTRGMDGAMAHVRYLADDALEGRAVGTAGERCAADYIVARFRAIGLEPAGTQGSYFHAFPVRSGAELGAGNELVVAGRPLTLGSEWGPLGFSASGEIRAPLVYGGHGVSSPGTPEDRFAHVDLAGRVVVVEAGDPDAAHGSSLRADP